MTRDYREYVDNESPINQMYTRYDDFEDITIIEVKPPCRISPNTKPIVTRREDHLFF